MMATLMTRAFGLIALLASALWTSPAAAQGNEALRGKMAMSVYVSIYGVTGNAEQFRLSLEQQLHDIGITVLPHADPPNFPVLNLTINVAGGILSTATRYSNGSMTTLDRPISRYSSRLELLQLVPGRTAAMRPIEDVAIWSTETASQTIVSEVNWRIPLEAMDLAIDFVRAWQGVNGANHPATVPTSVLPPNLTAAAASSSEPGQSLYADGSCQTRAGGGCVVAISRATTDSFEAVPNGHKAMVFKQLEDLQQRGQQVITCVYGPINTQAKTGYVPFSFWYRSAPADILKLLTSAFPHPFMNLGRVAVSACPATKAAANIVFASRFN
jgi:hypothetical protein